MVGDFQQAIFREPADLARYPELHDRLIEIASRKNSSSRSPSGSIEAQLDFVNATFPDILNNC